MADLTGKPTDSLQARDVRLAKIVNQVLDDPHMIATMSRAEVRENVLFCMKRLLVFRMGGRSAPLVALSSILQHAEPASLSFLSNETTAPRYGFDVETLLSTSFGIAVDPSFVWPEWALVVVAVVAHRLMPVLPMSENVRQEILSQMRLRLAHLGGKTPPLATEAVRQISARLLKALDAGFPEGVEEIANACRKSWPKSEDSAIDEQELQAETERLDRIIPGWYQPRDRALYRLSLERRDAWIVDKVHFGRK